MGKTAHLSNRLGQTIPSGSIPESVRTFSPSSLGVVRSENSLTVTVALEILSHESTASTPRINAYFIL